MESEPPNNRRQSEEEDTTGKDAAELQKLTFVTSGLEFRFEEGIERMYNIVKRFPLRDCTIRDYFKKVLESEGFARTIEKDLEAAGKGYSRIRLILQRSDDLTCTLERMVADNQNYIDQLAKLAELSVDDVKKLSSTISDGYVEEDVNL